MFGRTTSVATRSTSEIMQRRGGVRSPVHGEKQHDVPLKRQRYPRYRFVKTVAEKARRRRKDYVVLGRTAEVLMFEAALMYMVRPVTARWILAPLLLLLLGPSPAEGSDLIDLTLYGGAFDSSSTIAYSEV